MRHQSSFKFWFILLLGFFSTTNSQEFVCPNGFTKFNYDESPLGTDPTTSVVKSHVKFTCYRLFLEPRTWFEANETCVREGAFLPKMTNSLRSILNLSDSEYWIGLTTVFHNLQWISWPPEIYTLPKYAPSENWGLEIDATTFQRGDCAFIEIPSGILQLEDCKFAPTRKQFYCINNGITLDNITQGIDFEVVLESRGNLVVNLTEGERLPVLQCRVEIYNGMYVAYEEFFETVWVKDGIYISDEHGSSLNIPNSNFPVTNQNLFGVDAVNTDLLTYSGTYRCEVALKGQMPRYSSNTLRVSIADHDTALLTLEFLDFGQLLHFKGSLPSTLNYIFGNVEYVLATSSLDFGLPNPLLKRNQLKILAHRRGGLINYAQAFERIKSRLEPNSTNITDAFLTGYSFCPSYAENIDNRYIFWENTEGGDFAISSPPCVFQDYNTIFARKCVFDFENGSRWEEIPSNVVFSATRGLTVVLDDKSFENYSGGLTGNCGEGFVPLYSKGNPSYKGFCVTNVIEKPRNYEDALQFCREINADLPGPIVLDSLLWIQHFNFYGRFESERIDIWTTFNIRSLKSQWRSIFEKQFINKKLTLEMKPFGISEKFCTTAAFTDGVGFVNPKNCSSPVPFVCVKMVDRLSTSSQCPVGWMTSLDSGEDAPCWDGKIYFDSDPAAMPETCGKDYLRGKNISSILSGSRLLKSSMLEYKLNSNLTEILCNISRPYGHRTMTTLPCSIPLQSEEVTDIFVCVRKRAAKRPGRVVIGLLNGDPRKLQCKGYNIANALGVQWFFNDVLLYDTVLAQIDDRGFESIIEPKMHEQGYYRCEMRSANPLTSVVSREILFQLPNIINYISENVTVALFANCLLAQDEFRPIRVRLDKLHVSDYAGDGRIWRAFNVVSLGSKICNAVDVKNERFRNFTAQAMRMADRCPEGNGNFSRVWPETRTGAMAVPRSVCMLRDGVPATRRCLGDFNFGGYWEEDIYPRCEGEQRRTTIDLKILSEIPANVETVNRITTSLNVLTQNSSDIDKLDLHYVATTLENVASSNIIGRQEVEEVFQTFEHVLSVDGGTLLRAQTQMSTSVRIVTALSDVVRGSKIGEDPELQFSMLSAAVLKSKIRNLGYAYTEKQEQNITLASEFVNFNPKNDIDLDIVNSEVAFILPDDLAVHDRDAPVVASVILYKNSKLFFKTNIANESLVNATQYVISISIEGQSDSRWFYDPLKIYLEKSNDVAYDELKCVFLDTRFVNDVQWSQLGCVYNGTEHGKVVCLCDHLTDFSVLFERKGYDMGEPHKTILRIVTYVGIACSDIGLLFIVLTYTCHRKWRKGNMHHTIFNFSIALTVALTAYLLIDKVYKWKIACICLGAILHYFLMASFCWMVVEGVLQYLRFVKVIGTYIPRFMMKFGILAWGLPVIPVAVVLGLDVEYYINEDTEICWLTETPLMYGFILPLGLCLLLNLIVFCLVVANLAKCESPTVRVGYAQSNRNGLKRLAATFSTIILMGLLWIFGPGLVVMEKSEFKSPVLNYLFTICNSFQGFFIFLLQITMDSSVMELWQAKKLIRINPAEMSKTDSSGMDLRNVNNKFKSNRRHM